MTNMFITKLVLGVISILCIVTIWYCMKHKEPELFPHDISAPEDLMREHGLLNRVLLIYEEVINRIDHNEDFPAVQLAQSLEIVKKFIEEYHEKIEEDHIFPLFEKHMVEVDLVTTLREQHIRGRAMTNKLQLLVAGKQHDAPILNEIKDLLHQFIAMYRPHESREDTVIFPHVRSLVNEEEYVELAEMCEDTEEKVFGEHGFELMLQKVEDIEKTLGIYELH